MADYSSGLLTAFFGVGQVAGPIYGSVFAKHFGYRLTCDVVACTCLVVGGTYWWLVDGKSSFKRSLNSFNCLIDEGLKG